MSYSKYASKPIIAQPTGPVTDLAANLAANCQPAFLPTC